MVCEFVYGAHEKPTQVYLIKLCQNGLIFSFGQNARLENQQNPAGIGYSDFSKASEKLFSNHFVGKIKKYPS